MGDDLTNIRVPVGDLTDKKSLPRAPDGTFPACAKKEPNVRRQRSDPPANGNSRYVTSNPPTGCVLPQFKDQVQTVIGPERVELVGKKVCGMPRRPPAGRLPVAEAFAKTTPKVGIHSLAIQYMDQKPEEGHRLSNVAKLWEFRMKQGMCPHCGNKTHKRMLRGAFRPLTIPRYVNHGACCHPGCNPVHRTHVHMILSTPNDSGWDSDESNVNSDGPSMEADTIMSAIDDYRATMMQCIEKIATSSENSRETVAFKLEDVILQLYRAVRQTTFIDQAHLNRVKEDIIREVKSIRMVLSELPLHMEGAVNCLDALEIDLAGLRDAQVCKANEVLVVQLKQKEVELEEQQRRHQSELEELRCQHRSEMEVLQNQVTGKKGETCQKSESLALEWEIQRTQRSPRQYPAALRQSNNIVAGSSRCCLSLEGHADWVLCCAVFDNGRRALSGSTDKTLRLWDIVSGKMLKVWRGHSVNCCRLIDSGRKALTGNSDGVLRILNLETDDVTVLQDLTGHTKSVFCLDVSTNERLALSGSWDNTLRLWDIDTGQTMKVLEGHTLPVWCCVLFEGGRKALSGSWDHSLRLWDIETSKTLLNFEGHKKSVWCCELFDNQTKVLSCSKDKTLRTWSVETGKMLQVLRGHSAAVQCCAVFDNDTKVLSGGCDYKLRIWNLTTGETLHTIVGLTDAVLCCTVFDNGRKALTGSRSKALQVWDLEPRSAWMA